jgi:hypothetical protein
MGNFEKLIDIQFENTFPKCSTPCSHGLATGLSLEPSKCNPHSQTQLVNINSNFRRQSTSSNGTAQSVQKLVTGWTAEMSEFRVPVGARFIS